MLEVKSVWLLQCHLLNSDQYTLCADAADSQLFFLSICLSRKYFAEEACLFSLYSSLLPSPGAAFLI